MEYGVELASRKADFLLEYLKHTKNLRDLINEVGIKELDGIKVQECLAQRGNLISKIDEIDALLSRRQKDCGEDTQSLEKKFWLCDKLARQIAEIERGNGAIFDSLQSELYASMRKNSDSIKGVSTYHQHQLQNLSSKEWKK